jgi:FkbM family methyltransferase
MRNPIAIEIFADKNQRYKGTTIGSFFIDLTRALDYLVKAKKQALCQVGVSPFVAIPTHPLQAIATRRACRPRILYLVIRNSNLILQAFRIALQSRALGFALKSATKQLKEFKNHLLTFFGLATVRGMWMGRISMIAIKYSRPQVKVVAAGLIALCSLVLYTIGSLQRKRDCLTHGKAPLSTKNRSQRIYSAPARLCLKEPYNSCIRIPTEPEDVFVELLHACPGSRCSVLDVGSNRGAFISLALQHSPKSRIVAFEPHPTLSAELSQKFGHLHNVKLHNAGLSAAPGHLHAAVSFGNAPGYPKGYQEVMFIKGCSEINEFHRTQQNKTCRTIPTLALDDILDSPANIMKVSVGCQPLSA